MAKTASEKTCEHFDPKERAMDGKAMTLIEIADRLSKAPSPSYRHMETSEYRDGIVQMLVDLDQLARRDGCIAAAWALEVFTNPPAELVPLPEGAVVMVTDAFRRVNDGEYYLDGETGDVLRWFYSNASLSRVQVLKRLDPKPFGVPAGGEPSDGHFLTSARETRQLILEVAKLCGADKAVSDACETARKGGPPVTVNSGLYLQEIRTAIATLQADLKAAREEVERLTKEHDDWPDAFTEAERLRNQNRELAGLYETMKAQMGDADMEAGRLRKAIETLACECDRLADSLQKPETTKRICAAFAKTVADDLRAALTPSPATPKASASGEKQPEWCVMHQVCFDKSEGCPFCKRPTSAPAAESDGGEKPTLKSLAHSLTPLVMRDIDALAADRDAISARLAACEERCKELEDAAREVLVPESVRANWPYWLEGLEAAMVKLESLLAPKAG